MRMYKARVGCIAIFLLFTGGCGDNQQKAADVSKTDTNTDDSFEQPGVIETTGDFIIDISIGDNNFKPFRMLNESDNLAKAESDAFEEVWSILDNAKWETAEVSMSRPADYRVKVVDKRDKEKPFTTVYYLWANSEHESIELVDYDHTRYVRMKKPDSEKLYKFLTDKNLSDHVIIE